MLEILKRTKTSIGLDIGTHSIKLVGLRHTPKGVFLTHSAVRELPLEAMGEKGSKEVIAEKIKALFQEENFRAKKVFIGVSGAEVTIKAQVCVSHIRVAVTDIGAADEGCFSVDGAHSAIQAIELVIAGSMGSENVNLKFIILLKQGQVKLCFLIGLPQQIY